MRGLICRKLRLEWFAVLVLGLGMALAVPAMAVDGPQSTATTLTVETHVQNGRTVAMFGVAVRGEDGLPASGVVVIEEDGRQMAGAALSAEGHARLELTPTPGEHNFIAVYNGDASHQASVSQAIGARAQATATPSFGISVSPSSLSLTAGQSGSAIASVNPVNASALTAPMFVTLSCTGFPDQSSCTFTPENVEILPNATAPVTSSMVVTTQARNRTGHLETPGRMNGSPVALAALIPGALGMAGLALAARRRRWLNRLFLLALVGFVATLGTTACAPRYNYYNHGPPFNLPTPAGTYTMQLTAQSSNGITATTQSTSFVLTVK